MLEYFRQVWAGTAALSTGAPILFTIAPKMRLLFLPPKLFTATSSGFALQRGVSTRIDHQNDVSVQRLSDAGVQGVGERVAACWYQTFNHQYFGVVFDGLAATISSNNTSVSPALMAFSANSMESGSGGLMVGEVLKMVVERLDPDHPTLLPIGLKKFILALNGAHHTHANGS